MGETKFIQLAIRGPAVRVNSGTSFNLMYFEIRGRSISEVFASQGTVKFYLLPLHHTKNLYFQTCLWITAMKFAFTSKQSFINFDFSIQLKRTLIKIVNIHFENFTNEICPVNSSIVVVHIPDNLLY